MRLKLKLTSAEPVSLPLNYNHALQSALYSALPDDEYRAVLHEQGFGAGNRSFKLFTFGMLQGRYTVNREKKEICFPEEVGLELRSPDGELFRRFAASLCAGTELRLLGNRLMTAVSSAELSPKPYGGTTLIRMLSPITVYRTENGKTVYFSPEEAEFQSCVEGNLRSKYLAVFGHEDTGPVRLEPVKVKRCVTVFKGTYITAWNGYFLLTAEPAAMGFLYDCGLGGKNSQGFGMFEYAE